MNEPHLGFSLRAQTMEDGKLRIVSPCNKIFMYRKPVHLKTSGQIYVRYNDGLWPLKPVIINGIHHLALKDKPRWTRRRS